LFLEQSRNIYNVFSSCLDMAELPQQTNAASGQQGTAQQTSTPQQTTASPTSEPGSVTQQGQEPEANKKPKKWVWIVVGVLVIIAIITGAYFLFF